MPTLPPVMSLKEQMTLINDLGDCLHQNTDVNSIARAAVNIIAKSALSPVVSLFAVEDEKLVLLAQHDVSEFLLSTQQGKSLQDAGWQGRVALTQEIFYTNCIRLDERIDAEEKQHHTAGNIHCGVILPLLHVGSTEGILSIGYSREDVFNDDMLALLSTFGNVLSLALKDAQFQRQSEHARYHDALTGLFNRAYLFDVGYQVLSDILVLIDINRFKDINNTLGHSVGDSLLQHIGPRIQDSLTEVGAIICSLGGDSFAVLAPHLSRVSPAEFCAELDAGLRQPFVLSGVNLELNFSMGYACSDDTSEDSIELYRRADIALASCKHHDGGIVAYCKTMESDRTERLAILSDLGDAIRESQLQLHYQPKIDLNSGALVGCEALLRWQHPKHGMLSPANFIPIVEASRWIIPLTEWVVSEALRQVNVWKSMGRDICVAVNLSPRNLEDDGCCNMIAEQLKVHNLPAHCLILEVTEMALMLNPEASLLQVQKLSSLGVKFALDDYGTGYSSLSYIRDLTLMCLKIDRSFISNMLSNSADQVIVESTINMAHSLGLRVVAEGIEDLETATALKEMGCDAAQGYYFARPMPAEDFNRWLDSRS